jgi:2,4-dienoyl-CoA reductase (NADPH2)
MNRFAKLLEPGQIGRVTTRNRIIKTANGTSLMEADQTVGDRMIAYYENLAKGGVGLLTVESCGVEYPLGIHHLHYEGDRLIGGVQLHFDDDRFIPGFKRLTDVIHKYRCPCSIQLLHSGPWNPAGNLPKRNTRCSSNFSEDELPGRNDFASCRAMTREEIEEQIDLWASAVVRVQKAGFDAVELNNGTCHLGNTFLSRVWNRRDDEYGPQSFENRTRFLRRIIAEARRRTGPEFTITVLMNMAEYNHERGTTVAEGAEMARWIAEGGADGINCRAHSYGDRNGLQHPERLLYPEAPEHLPKDLDWSHNGHGATVPLVEAAKRRAPGIPIWTACRIDPELGEKFLREGRLDFVGMTRRLIADPELPNKIAQGRLEDVCWCHGCLHCFDVRSRNGLIECRVNATLGRETDIRFAIIPAKKKKKVLVAGGGPSGMEAARVAAKRGHAVVLYERASYLGGVMPMAALVKDLERQDIGKFLEYQKTQLKKEGVTVHLKRHVDAEVVARERPDVVVIATGAAHSRFDVPGSSSRKVLSGERLYGQLRFWMRFFNAEWLARLTKLYMPVGKRVVIAGGTLHGCELAEFLVKRKRQVTLVHNGPASQLGEGMTLDDLYNLWPWLKKKNVEILSEVVYKRITDEGFEIVTKDGSQRTLKMDSLITTQDYIPNTQLYDELKGLVPEVYNIGSSSQPGLIVHAIKDGAEIGCAI